MDKELNDFIEYHLKVKINNIQDLCMIAWPILNPEAVVQRISDNRIILTRNREKNMYLFDNSKQRISNELFGRTSYDMETKILYTAIIKHICG